MAELVQLDVAAGMIGKSEVTLRRLIKAEKIPFQKEKTLTGFIYLVDPDVVRAYYQSRDADIFGSEEFAATPFEEPAQASRPVEASASKNSSVRVAIAHENGSPVEYWQKRAEIYEDRYTQEVVKHAQTREDLGVWRGRAEQAQTMLIKLLPAPNDVEVHHPKQAETPNPAQSAEASPWLVSILVSLILLIILAGGAFLYARLR